jgi:hypothetical protein
MNKFKKVVVLVLAVVALVSCHVEDDLYETVSTCDSIDAEYNKLVVDLALSNGWVPEEYSFNSTTIGDDFLNPFADPNIQIFLFAYGTYAQDWANARNINGCF